MKNIVTIIIFTCFHLSSIAQYSITGIVVNSLDASPLNGASVFINNASKGTVTDKDGRFTLSDISVSNFELVISFVSFQTIVVKITPENIGKRFRIQMSPKQEELQEVVVAPIDKDGWKNWGKIFADHFIGTSKNAQRCVIENPSVLRFRYDKKSQILRVTSVDKLVVINKALGYTINYQLEEFRFNRRQHMITYLGYSSYNIMEANSRRKKQNWIASRRDAYNGSLMHFMRSFYVNNVTNEGFELRQLIRLYKRDTATADLYNRIMNGDRAAVDTSRFIIELMRGDGLFSGDPIIYILGKKLVSTDSIRLYDTTTKSNYLNFINSLQVIYKNEHEKPEYITSQNFTRKPRSFQESILFLTNNRPVLVEQNGLFFEPLDVFTEGYWAWERIAETLPIDYKPGD